MMYVLDNEQGSIAFKIWNSDTLGYEEPMLTRDVINKLIENPNSFGNSWLTSDEDLTYLDGTVLTNQMIYGKLYENIITCGSIKLTMLDDTYLVLENHTGIYVSPCKMLMDYYYLPVYLGGIFKVLKNDDIVQKFTKTKYTMKQLKRFSILGGWEKVYDEYRENVKNYKVYTSFPVSTDIELLNGGMDVLL